MLFLYRRLPSCELASSSGNWEVLPGPLTKQLRVDWGRGQILTTKVLETAKNARDQGAWGLDRLADKKKGNEMRDFKRALGWPPNAPEVKFIDVPLKGGERAHPVFCPIETFEKIVADDEFSKKLYLDHLRQWRITGKI